MKVVPLSFLACLASALPSRPETSPTVRGAEVSYNGYHIYIVTPSSAEHARELGKRFSKYHTHPTRDTLSIAIPPAEVDSFLALGLKTRLVNSDLGAYIRSTDKVASYSTALHKRGELPDLSWFNTYHPYADHLRYWDDLVHAFPKNSEKFAIGKSFENRTIYAFHLYGDKKKYDYEDREEVKEKPVILWHATVHAREWISTMGKSPFAFAHQPGRGRSLNASPVALPWSIRYNAIQAHRFSD